LFASDSESQKSISPASQSDGLGYMPQQVRSS
jgi:hypothetical protein